MSGSLCATEVFVEILMTGLTALPVGVPSPVEKIISVACAPAMAVVDSTSLPGVHSRFSPGFDTTCG